MPTDLPYNWILSLSIENCGAKTYTQTWLLSFYEDEHLQKNIYHTNREMVNHDEQTQHHLIITERIS